MLYALFVGIGLLYPHRPRPPRQPARQGGIAESLAIVGVIAAIGAVPYARQNPVDWQSVRYFRVREDQGAYIFQHPPQIRDRPRRRMTIDKRRLSSVRNGPGPIDQFAESETSTSDFGSSAKPAV